jgi:hypothetical protein
VPGRVDFHVNPSSLAVGAKAAEGASETECGDTPVMSARGSVWDSSSCAMHLLGLG